MVTVVKHGDDVYEIPDEFWQALISKLKSEGLSFIDPYCLSVRSRKDLEDARRAIAETDIVKWALQIQCVRILTAVLPPPALEKPCLPPSTFLLQHA
jgi:hypothetical protein